MNRFAIGLAAATLCFGCASNKENVSRRANWDGQSPGEVNDDRAPGRASIRIDQRLATSCSAPTDAKAEAQFEFNSASVSQDAAGRLNSLVQCLTTGAMKGKTIAVVGHADQRGTEEYNKDLGYQRASNVAQYLRAQGVTEAQLKVQSRGEAEASGTTEQGMAQDRIVEVALAE